MNWYKNKQANKNIDNYLVNQVQKYTSGADTHAINNLLSVYTSTVYVFNPSDEIINEMERILKIYVGKKKLGKIVNITQLKQMMSNAAQKSQQEYKNIKRRTL